MAKIIVTWEIDDGYCGSRPLKTSFESSDYEDDDWDCVSEERKQEIINDVVEQDFRNNVQWYTTNVEVR